MKDAIQTLLIEPNDDNRQYLQQLLGGLGSLRLSESLAAYQGAARRITELSPQLVVIGVDADPGQAVPLIQAISRDFPGVTVLPVSRVRDSSVILGVIRAGAREFLTLPAGPEEIQETFDRLFNRRDDSAKGAAAPQGPQVIAITGAAGGIGCTTLAVNLATTLAKTSASEVVLADFDLMLGSLDACLDVIPDQTLQTVIQNLDRLDLTLLKRSITRHPSGLYVLPHPVLMEDAAKLDPDDIQRVLGLLKAAFPTIVIDTSKGLQPSDFVAFEAAEVILVVLQLDLSCLRNTARLLQLFQQFEGLSDRIKLIVSRSGSHETEISRKKAEETLRMPISWEVPNATKIVHAARAKGVPLDVVAPGSRVHQSILEIAKGLKPPPESDAAKPRRGLFAAFF